MTPVIYALSSTTVPQAGVIDVPCYREDAFNGRTARLAYEEKWVPFDFATLTERDYELATAERGEEWTIQGVVAVDMDWLVGVMDTTAAAGKTLGVQIDEVWYYVSPMNMEPTVVGDGYVVIGLYR